MELKATNVNGVDYYTVIEFGALVGKSVAQIYGLIHKELIKHEVILNKTLIRASELEKAHKLLSKKKFTYSGTHNA